MSLVTAETLKEWSGAKHRAKLQDWLSRRNIRYFLDSSGWPCTTDDAINVALGINSGWEPTAEGFNAAAKRPRETRKLVSRQPEERKETVDQAVQGGRR